MQNENRMLLFTDGSVDTKTGVGWGAILLVSESGISDPQLKENVRTRRFEATSSTKLELQTMLWALSEIGHFKGEISVFTDSQNIVGLFGRRGRLEKNNYCSKTGRPINNAELYRAFFQLTDGLNCGFIKIEGHKKTTHKNGVEKIFTLVDRASRSAVRQEMKGEAR